jgi:CBS domain-containing protein
MSASAACGAADELGGAAIAFLRRHPLFDEIEADALRFIGSRLRVGYYPKDTPILTPEQGEPAYFYIVQRGLVNVAPPAYQLQPPTVVSLRAGECFSVGALLEHRPVSSTYFARTDAFCYQLLREDFDSLLARSPRFRQFCTRYLASLLQESRRLLNMQSSSAAAEQQAMGRSLRSLIQKPAVACTRDTSLERALRTMQQKNVGSILVQEHDGRLVGIFTRHDVLDRVALVRRDLSEPIAAVMTPQPRTLSADHTAYDAALLIAHHGIRHVPVVQDGRAVGVVTERDLFALDRSSLRAIHRTIARAQTIDELVVAARDVRRLAQNLLALGVWPEQLMHLVSTLNDALTRRALELIRTRHELADIQWCWLAFGSEGRLEQTIATDQDNGLIFADIQGRSADSVREQLLPFARAVNEVLNASGFPLCKGNVMAGNPRWCLSRREWEAQFAAWVENTDPQALLGAAIFFDFRPVDGESGLAESLRAALLTMTARNARFLRQLAQQALDSRPPLGVLGDFLTQDVDHGPRTLDLKNAGARLFVDAARVLSLATGVAHTNTAQRVRQAGRKLHMNDNEIGSAVDAFFFVQGLRLRAQLASQADGEHADPNRIDPDRLNEVDRRILKESFRQARKLQARLALDHGL